MIKNNKESKNKCWNKKKMNNTKMKRKAQDMEGNFTQINTNGEQ